MEVDFLTCEFFQVKERIGLKVRSTDRGSFRMKRVVGSELLAGLGRNTAERFHKLTTDSRVLETEGKNLGAVGAIRHSESPLN